MKPLGAALLCVLLLSVGVVHAQDAFDAAQRASQARNPAGLTCTLALPEGRAQFQQGEIIRVTLRFASSKPSQYRFNPFQDERIPLDTLHVTPPEGVTDPLAEERSGPVMFSGFIPPPVPLTDKPVSITLILNALLRFDRPGTYRLYVTSKRILDGKDETRVSIFAAGRPVASNAVSFTIAPADPAWAHTQVESALAQHPPALDVLGYLDTREAAQALLSVLAADRYPRSSESNGYAIRRGLIGFPDRPWLVGEMARNLTTPDYAVTQPFLETLATLAARQQKAKDAGPLLRRQLWTQAASAVPAKSLTALPMTLHTLLETAWLTADVGKDAGIQARLPDLTRRMASVFDRLPPLPQEYLLGSDWRRMRTPALLPALRRLWAAAVRPENNDYGRNDLILRRLYDLSPKEGRALILKEAATPRPRVTAAALSVLPDRTLPALDRTLAANLADRNGDGDTASRLIARYATPTIFDRVRSFYGGPERGWDCAFQSGVLAYFLRVRPEYGAAAVNKALAMRKQTGCYKYLFTEVAPLHYDAILEKAAVAHLNDPDPEVVADTSEVLGKYGSRRAESALWARLRRTDDKAVPRERFEWRLVEALATAQNWYETRTRLQQVRALCATDNMRRQVDQYIGENNPSGVHIDYDLLGNTDRWTVGPYMGTGYAAFAAKMAQFPRGTIFSWQDWGMGAEEERLFTRFQRFAQAHGMTLTRWRPRFGG